MANAFLSPDHPAGRDLTQKIEGLLQEGIALLGTSEVDQDIPIHPGEEWTTYYHNGQPVLSVGPLKCTQVVNGDTIKFTFSRETYSHVKDKGVTPQ